MEWKIDDAETHLDEIIARALTGERQRIHTDEGVVVVISQEELEQIEDKPKSFGEHILNFPKVEEADFSRDKSLPRDFEW